MALERPCGSAVIQTDTLGVVQALRKGEEERCSGHKGKRCRFVKEWLDGLVALCLKGGSWKSSTPKGVMEMTPRSRFITEDNAEADRRDEMDAGTLSWWPQTSRKEESW